MALCAVRGGMLLAIVAGLSAGGCSAFKTTATPQETCRSSPSDPAVTVCQDGGDISVFAGHGQLSNAEAAARAALEPDDLPRARPQTTVTDADVSGCRPTAAAERSDDENQSDELALVCRLELTVTIPAGNRS